MCQDTWNPRDLNDAASPAPAMTTRGAQDLADAADPIANGKSVQALERPSENDIFRRMAAARANAEGTRQALDLAALGIALSRRPRRDRSTFPHAMARRATEPSIPKFLSARQRRVGPANRDLIHTPGDLRRA